MSQNERENMLITLKERLRPTDFFNSESVIIHFFNKMSAYRKKDHIKKVENRRNVHYWSCNPGTVT